MSWGSCCSSVLPSSIPSAGAIWYTRTAEDHLMPAAPQLLFCHLATCCVLRLMQGRGSEIMQEWRLWNQWLGQAELLSLTVTCGFTLRCVKALTCGLKTQEVSASGKNNLSIRLTDALKEPVQRDHLPERQKQTGCFCLSLPEAVWVFLGQLIV